MEKEIKLLDEKDCKRINQALHELAVRFNKENGIDDVTLAFVMLNTSAHVINKVLGGDALLKIVSNAMVAEIGSLWEYGKES